MIWLLLFGNVFSSVGTVPGFGSDDYMTFLVPGILMMTVLYSGAWAGTGFIDDISSGVMDRMLTSPVHGSSLVAGQLVQQLLICVVQGICVLGIGVLAGARYAGGCQWHGPRDRGVAAARRRVLLAVGGRRAAGPRPDRPHRHLDDHRAAGDVHLDRTHARGAAARLGADHRPATTR